MIRHAGADDDIMESKADWLVDPVCCVAGVMGAGLALRFREVFPGLRTMHRHYCRTGQLRPGRVVITGPLWRRGADPNLEPAPVERVVMFPSKAHWASPSRIEHIEEGLADLVMRAGHDPFPPRSIAISAIGCGLGGLRWDDVKSRIDWYARTLPEVEWIIYPPR